jgi:uncharacterized protein (DUF1810 family)
MTLSHAKDGFHLQRFLEAQAPVYEQALSELREGRKRSHWMWFIFPQMRGLGHSEMANVFGISSLAEAKEYLAHPVLGPRLRECTRAVTAVQGRSITHIFGYPDDLKFHSSITLFSKAAPQDQVFTEALEKYFGGSLDPATLQLL